MKKKALIVDDSADIRMVVQSYLEEYDLEIETAEDGLQAAEKIQDHPYDILFIDMIMPKMDGPELIEAIREIESNKGYSKEPIIVLSGSSDAEDWQRAEKAGMDFRLSKPIEMKKLESIMAELGLETN